MCVLCRAGETARTGRNGAPRRGNFGSRARCFVRGDYRGEEDLSMSMSVVLYL